MRDKTILPSIREGDSLYDKGDYENALYCYNKILESNPENSNALFGKWLVFKKKGDVNAALECLNKLFTIASKAKNAKFWNSKGDILLEKYDYESALICYNRAIELKPAESTYWHNKGYTLDEKDDYENALACYEEAIKLKPKEALYWKNKGCILRKKGDYENALICYDKAIELKPAEAADYWTNKGDTFRKKGDYENALLCYDKAIELKPKRTLYWLNKGNALKSKGDHQGALACYNKVIELKPARADDWDNKGSAYQAKGEYDNALACYDKVLKLNPKAADYWHNNRGIIFYAKGEYENALACYDEAIKLKPTDAICWRNKGNTLRKKGDYEGALICCNKAIELKPKEADYWNVKGNIYYYKGDYENALICYNKAIELKPKEACLWNNKSLILFLQGQYEKAAQHFEQALALNPHYAFALQSKAVYLFWQGNIMEANQLLEQALQALIQQEKSKSDMADLWVVRGQLFLAIGATEKAKQAFETALEKMPNDAVAQQALAKLERLSTTSIKRKRSWPANSVAELLAQGELQRLDANRVQLIFKHSHPAEALLAEVLKLSLHPQTHPVSPRQVVALPPNPNNNNDHPRYVLELRQAEYQALQQPQVVPEPLPSTNPVRQPSLDEIRLAPLPPPIVLADLPSIEPEPMRLEPIRPVIPPEYCCPITHELMENPVIAADGNTYERKAIAEHLETHSNSPLTNMPLEHKFLWPNTSLKKQIDAFRQQRPDLAPQQNFSYEQAKDKCYQAIGQANPDSFKQLIQLHPRLLAEPVHEKKTALQLIGEQGAEALFKILLQFPEALKTEARLLPHIYHRFGANACQLLCAAWKWKESDFHKQFWMAFHQDDIALVDTYLQLGLATVDLRENNEPDGMTPLQWAILAKKPLEMVFMLLNHKADPALCNRKQENALHLAVFTKNKPIIERLLKYGAQVVVSFKLKSS